MTPTFLATLQRMFGEAIGGGPVAADANYFASGGDSLGAAGVLAQVEEQLGVQLVYRDFLEAPTPARLALTILRERARQRGGDLATEIAALSPADAAVLVTQLKAQRKT